MEYKTYVLLDALDSTAPVFQTVGNGQRVQIKKIPLWEPTLRQTFQDKNGEGHTIRYKEASKFIDQGMQIEKEKLDANIPWTTSERADRKFVHGICITKKKIFMEYLGAHPANIKFDGYCSNYPAPCFKELDEKADLVSENSELKKRVNAAYKVFGISLEEKQALLLRLLGSFYQVSDDPAACENDLVKLIDDGDERLVDEVLRTETTDDEKVSILIGMLLSKGKLSFTKEPNQISIQKGGRWISAKEVSDEYPMEERKRYLLEFLTSSAGKTLLGEMYSLLEPSGKLVIRDSADGETSLAVEAEVQDIPKEDKVNDSELELAEKELAEAVKTKAHHLTIKKLEKRVNELKGL